MSTIERLTKRPDFLAAAEGRRFHTERMTAQARLRAGGATEPGPDSARVAGLRLGFTITKRVGHATERNRIRRRLRAAVAAVSGDLPQAPADIVLIARRPALAAAFDTLKDDLRRAIPAVLRPRAPGEEGKRGPAKRGGPAKARPPGGVFPGDVPRATTSSRRDAAPGPAPSATQNACGGVPDGQ